MHNMPHTVMQIYPRTGSPNLQSEEDGDTNRRLDERHFKRLLLFLEVFGFRINKERNKGEWKYGFHLKQFYWFVIGILFVVDAGRFMTILKTETFNGSLATKLSYASMFIFPIYTHWVVGITCSWASCAKSYKRYCELYPTSMTNIQWRRIAMVAASVTMSLLALSVAFYIVPLIVDMPEDIIIAKIHTPFEASPVHVKAGLSVLMIAVRFYGVMSQTCLFGWFYIACNELVAKYCIITTELKKMLSGGSDDLIQFDALRRQHEDLTDVLSDANTFFGQVAFAVYGGSIPLLCLILYGTITGNLQIPDFLSLLGSLSAVAIPLTLVTFQGVRLNDAVSKDWAFKKGISNILYFKRS